MNTEDRIKELRELVAESRHSTNAAGSMQYWRLKAQLAKLTNQVTCPAEYTQEFTRG
jgi:hypothetical protein